MKHLKLKTIKAKDIPDKILDKQFQSHFNPDIDYHKELWKDVPVKRTKRPIATKVIIKPTKITLKTKDENGITYGYKIEWLVSQFKPFKKNKKLPDWWNKEGSEEERLDWMLEGMSDYGLLSDEGERLYELLLKKMYK
jgi:hypothetical protein